MRKTREIPTAALLADRSRRARRRGRSSARFRALIGDLGYRQRMKATLTFRPSRSQRTIDQPIPACQVGGAIDAEVSTTLGHAIPRAGRTIR